MNNPTLLRWTMVTGTVLAASVIKDLLVHQVSDVTLLAGVITMVLVFKQNARRTRKPS